MKPTFTRLFLLLITLRCLTAGAQTLTTNPENWSTLVPAGSCSNCSIYIPSGYVLNLNNTSTCTNCTFFNSGTINVAAGFNFSTNIINGGILNINTAPNT